MKEKPIGDGPLPLITTPTIKVYADVNRAIYKDADKILLDWHEMRALSDTHEATLINIKKL